MSCDKEYVNHKIKMLENKYDTYFDSINKQLDNVKEPLVEQLKKDSELTDLREKEYLEFQEGCIKMKKLLRVLEGLIKELKNKEA